MGNVFIWNGKAFYISRLGGGFSREYIPLLNIMEPATRAFNGEVIFSYPKSMAYFQLL